MSKIETAAAVYVAARESVRDLRKQRARCRCSREVGGMWDEPVETSAGFIGPVDHVPPCWKAYDNDGETAPVEAWCEGCQRREVIHLALCAALPRIGGAYLALRRAIRTPL